MHPIHDTSSDLDAVSASTESRVPPQRTPRKKLSDEELHRSCFFAENEFINLSLDCE